MRAKAEFKLVASVLAEEYLNTREYGTKREARAIETVILKMTDAFQEKYPYFNRIEFLRDCGYDV